VAEDPEKKKQKMMGQAAAGPSKVHVRISARSLKGCAESGTESTQPSDRFMREKSS
jgi:hypothetical protein